MILTRLVGVLLISLSVPFVWPTYAPACLAWGLGLVLVLFAEQLNENVFVKKLSKQKISIQTEPTPPTPYDLKASIDARASAFAASKVVSQNEKSDARLVELRDVLTKADIKFPKNQVAAALTWAEKEYKDTDVSVEVMFMEILKQSKKGMFNDAAYRQ